MEQRVVIEMRPVGVKLDADMESFALGIKMWRIRHGLSQKQAARLAGVCRETWNRCEQARGINWRTLYKVFAFISNES